MFNFSTSNIGFNSLQNLLGLRLEGFLLRIRYAVYTILITCLTSFPLACCLSILLLELAHILLYIYYVARYRYAKNWFLFVSKGNVSIALLTISSIGIYLNISNKDPMSFQNQVNPGLQYLGIGIFIFCLSLETIILVLNVLFAIYLIIKKRRASKGKGKKGGFFGHYWVQNK